MAIAGLTMSDPCAAPRNLPAASAVAGQNANTVDISMFEWLATEGSMPSSDAGINTFAPRCDPSSLNI